MQILRLRPHLSIALLVIGVLAASCSPDSQPSATEWQPKWDAIVATVPDLSEIADPPDERMCEDTLADLRELSQDLLPAPSESIDDLVNDWVAVSEEAFFECPPEGDINSFDDAYREMKSIEDSIAVALTDLS